MDDFYQVDIHPHTTCTYRPGKKVLGHIFQAFGQMGNLIKNYLIIDCNILQSPKCLYVYILITTDIHCSVMHQWTILWCCIWLIDCSSFIRHLWQSTKHIKRSSKVVHKNNTIRAYNHTTYITRSYSASQVSCTHVLVVWISSNQFHVSHLGQHCNWCFYMVLPQCQWRRKLGWQAYVLTHGNTQYI